MAKAVSKKNLSSMQVLKTLQILLQGNFTMQELIKKLNLNEEEPVFNNSVVSKYINTCRYFGIEIPKIHNKYFVTSLPFGMDLTNSDINLFENLQKVVKNEMTNKNNKLFDKLLEKINRFSNKKIARVEKETYCFVAELFESAIKEKRKVKLMFKSRVDMVCIPLKIAENKGKMFFNVLYKNKERMIASERIAGIEALSEKYSHNFNSQAVIFRLSDGLAKRYSLKENEQLMSKNEDESIVISNRGENKEILFARLLRYDKYCEILSPKIYREEIKEILDSALKNYGVM